MFNSEIQIMGKQKQLAYLATGRRDQFSRITASPLHARKSHLVVMVTARLRDVCNDAKPCSCKTLRHYESQEDIDRILVELSEDSTCSCRIFPVFNQFIYSYRLSLHHL